MEFHNHKHHHQMESLFGSELDNSLFFNPEITDVNSSDFSIDDYTISSALFSNTLDQICLPIQMEMNEESNRKRQRMHLISPVQQCVYLSVPENSTPLGLTLRKTPSFLNLVEAKLSCSNASFSLPMNVKDIDAEASAQQIYGKTKASNFSASLLRIGSWEQISRYDGELVAKFYFAKRKLVWEVLDCGLKSKIEVMLSDISALKATCNDDANQTLEIELLRRPCFFCETKPQPRKHTLWKATADFTGGQALIFRRHVLQFPPGTLRKHYKKLLQLDERLLSLSKKPYPSLDSPFFSPDNLEEQIPNGHNLFGLEGHNSVTLEGLLKSDTTNNYELLPCCTLSRPTNPPQYSYLDLTVASSDMGLPVSFSGASYLDHRTSVFTTNTSPSVYVSLPPSMPSYSATDMNESCHAEKEMECVKKDVFKNDLGVVESYKVNLNSALNFNSTCWISEVQTNQNLVGSSEDWSRK